MMFCTQKGLTFYGKTASPFHRALADDQCFTNNWDRSQSALGFQSFLTEDFHMYKSI